jgi:hypothetical protein
MKAVKYLMFVILVGSLLSACGAASEPIATPLPESMKGYELYSWREGNEWNFSLLVGTNREKTLDEIKDSKIVLRGVDALISALEQMPAGQYITWSSRETLSFPPDDIIEQVKQSCEDKGLILNLAL